MAVILVIVADAYGEGFAAMRLYGFSVACTKAHPENDFSPFFIVAVKYSVK